MLFIPWGRGCPTNIIHMFEVKRVWGCPTKITHMFEVQRVCFAEKIFPKAFFLNQDSPHKGILCHIFGARKGKV